MMHAKESGVPVAPHALAARMQTAVHEVFERQVAAGVDLVMSAASPGVVSLFFRNDSDQTHEAYLYAIAEAMRPGYEAVAKADFTRRAAVNTTPAPARADRPESAW
jgi:hypothetical protein